MRLHARLACSSGAEEHIPLLSHVEEENSVKGHVEQPNEALRAMQTPVACRALHWEACEKRYVVHDNNGLPEESFLLRLRKRSGLLVGLLVFQAAASARHAPSALRPPPLILCLPPAFSLVPCPFPPPPYPIRPLFADCSPSHP